MEEIIRKAEEKGINVILREIEKTDPKESLNLRIKVAMSSLKKLKSI